MNAYLTFIRKIDSELHFLGIPNTRETINSELCYILSGQPVICVFNNNKLSSLYLIRNDGYINQIIGEKDDLFLMKTIKDVSLLNINKYNAFKFYIANMFQCLSFEEMNFQYNLMTELENKIFYNFLHTEVTDFKKLIIREVRKSNWPDNYKIRLINKLNETRNISKKLLNKKIDINLQGYGIYINTSVK